MELWYPITGTFVLDTGTFFQYGGDSLDATTAQLNAALCIAEQLVQLQLNTFIEPQSWTGTFDRLAYYQPITLPHSHLRSLDSITLVCERNRCECTTRRIDSCGYIKNRPASIIELRIGQDTTGSCSCGQCGGALSFEIAYTAGIPSGHLASSPIALMALTAVAEEALTQMVDPGASPGGPGAPGIESWSQFRYREKRFGQIVTQLGNSARAQYAAKLLQPWKVKRSYKLGY